MLGSDAPYGQSNLKKNIERLHLLNITDSERVKILGENVRKLLEL